MVTGNIMMIIGGVVIGLGTAGAISGHVQKEEATINISYIATVLGIVAVMFGGTFA